MSLDEPQDASILSAAEQRRAEDDLSEAKTNPLTADTDDLLERGTKEFDALREEVLVRGGNAGFLYTDDPDPLTAKKKAALAEAQHYAIVQQETYKHYIEDLAYFTDRLEEGGLFDDEHWKEDLARGARLYDAYINKDPDDITSDDHKKMGQISISLFIEAESDPAKKAEVMADPRTRGLYFMGEAYYAEMLAANPELKNLSKEDKAAFKAKIMENFVNKFNEDPEAWAEKAESIRQQLGPHSVTAGRFSDLSPAEQDQYLETFHSFNERLIETGYTTPEGATPAEVRISYAEQKEAIFQQFKKENPDAAGLERIQHFVTKEHALARDELYVYATNKWANELVAETMANIGEEDLEGGGQFAGGVGDIERIVILQDVDRLTMGKFLDSLPEEHQVTEDKRDEILERIKNDDAYKQQIIKDFSKQYAEAKHKQVTEAMEKLNERSEIPADIGFYSKIPQEQLDGFFAKGRENLNAADIAKIYDHLSDEEFEQAFGESRGDFFSKFAGNEVYQKVMTDRLYSTKEEYDALETTNPELHQQLEAQKQQAEQQKSEEAQQEQQETDAIPAFDLSSLSRKEVRTKSSFGGTMEARSEITQAISEGKTNSKDLSPAAQKALQEYIAKREEPTDEVGILADQLSQEHDIPITVTDETPGLAQGIPANRMDGLRAISSSGVDSVTVTVSDDRILADFRGEILDMQYKTDLTNDTTERMLKILAEEHPELLQRDAQAEGTDERKPFSPEEKSIISKAMLTAVSETLAAEKKNETEMERDREAEKVAEFEKSAKGLEMAAADAPEELKGTLSQLAKEKAQTEQAATQPATENAQAEQAAAQPDEEKATEEPKPEVKEMASLDKPTPPDSAIQASKGEATEASKASPAL